MAPLMAPGRDVTSGARGARRVHGALDPVGVTPRLPQVPARTLASLETWRVWTACGDSSRGIAAHALQRPC